MVYGTCKWTVQVGHSTSLIPLDDWELRPENDKTSSDPREHSPTSSSHIKVCMPIPDSNHSKYAYFQAN